MLTVQDAIVYFHAFHPAQNMRHIASAILHEAAFGEGTTHRSLPESHTLAVRLVLDTMLQYLHPIGTEPVAISHLGDITTPGHLVDLLQLTLVLLAVPATPAAESTYLKNVLQAFVTDFGNKFTIQLTDGVNTDINQGVLIPVLTYLAQVMH